MGINWNSVQIDGVNTSDAPDFVDAYLIYAEYENGIELTEVELERATEENPDLIYEKVINALF